MRDSQVPVSSVLSMLGSLKFMSSGLGDLLSPDSLELSKLVSCTGRVVSAEW